MNVRGKFKDIISVVSSKLSRRFAFYTVGVSIVVAFIISFAFLYKSYQDGLDNLKKELTQVEHSVKSSLALHLWQMNQNALNIILNDLLMNKDVVYVELLDEKGNVLIEKGDKPARHDIKKRIPLYHHQQDDGESVYLGELKYIATTESLYKESKRAIVVAVIVIFIFFLVFTLIILFIYWDTTVKHLLAIGKHMKKIRLVGYKEAIGDLILERGRRNKNGKRDELDELVLAINEMHHEIVEQYTAIEYQSLHDTLTGLPNRRKIQHLIQDATMRSRKIQGYGALLSVDMDNFKLLNESMGHTVGDQMLCEIASRLTTVCNEKLKLARISGDEFLILQDTIVSSRNEARKIAEMFSKQLLSNISQPITIDDHHFKLTACIGIAVFGPNTSPDVLVKQSDNALHHAKSEGPGHIELFEPAMQQKIDRRIQIDRLLDKAIDEDLLFINYQPKCDGQGKICSAEALVRMHDEEGSVVYPGEFIPVLEETGDIIAAGDHIIRKIFEFVNKHNNDIKRSGLKSISINVSPTQYSAEGFVDRVITFAKQFDIEPRSIIFEITEDVVASSIDNVVDVMHRLTQYGFRFSIDDFGTGYSSLRYLKNLPLGELKIDKSFVDDVTAEGRAAAIVKTIIDMAHNFNLDVVAEGVESEEQLNILAKYQCELYQGFFFSRPLMEEDFLAALKSTAP